MAADWSGFADLYAGSREDLWLVQCTFGRMFRFFRTYLADGPRLESLEHVHERILWHVSRHWLAPRPNGGGSKRWQLPEPFSDAVRCVQWTSDPKATAICRRFVCPFCHARRVLYLTKRVQSETPSGPEERPPGDRPNGVLLLTYGWSLRWGEIRGVGRSSPRKAPVPRWSDLAPSRYRPETVRGGVQLVRLVPEHLENGHSERQYALVCSFLLLVGGGEAELDRVARSYDRRFESLARGRQLQRWEDRLDLTGLAWAPQAVRTVPACVGHHFAYPTPYLLCTPDELNELLDLERKLSDGSASRRRHWRTFGGCRGSGRTDSEDEDAASKPARDA